MQKKIKMLIENADILNIGKIDKRLYIAAMFMTAKISTGDHIDNYKSEISKYLDIADDMIKQNNERNKDEPRTRRETKG